MSEDEEVTVGGGGDGQISPSYVARFGAPLRIFLAGIPKHRLNSPAPTRFPPSSLLFLPCVGMHSFRVTYSRLTASWKVGRGAWTSGGLRSSESTGRFTQESQFYQR